MQQVEQRRVLGASESDPMKKASTPGFTLKGEAARLHSLLSEEQQESATEYCNAAAAAELKAGGIIKNPPGFYSIQLHNWFKATGTSPVDIPHFELPVKAMDLFDALTLEEQVEARKWCCEGARTVLQSGSTIRHPASFYSNVFHKFLSKIEREQRIMKHSCESPNKRAHAAAVPAKQCDGVVIRSSTSTPTKTNDASKLSKWNNSSSPSKTDPTIKLNFSKRKDPERPILSHDLLRTEILEMQDKLEFKTQECESLSEMFGNMSRMWQKENNMAKTVVERLQKMERYMESLRRQVASLSEENRQADEKLASTQETLRAMTATFTRVSQELCHERQARENLESALEKEKELSHSKNLEIREFKADVDRMAMLHPGWKRACDDGVKSQLALASLRRELEETQEQLADEKQKNAAELPLAYFVPETILVQDCTPPHSPRHVFDVMPPNRVIQTSSSFSPGGGLEERVRAELKFLFASFGDSELTVESKSVTRKLRLPFDSTGETVSVDLILSLNEGYPTSVPLGVEAHLSTDGSPISIEARMLALEMLPTLVEACRRIAEGSLGGEALYVVLLSADQWVHLDWAGNQAKRLPTKYE